MSVGYYTHAETKVYFLNSNLISLFPYPEIQIKELRAVRTVITKHTNLYLYLSII